ncbi:MULTISPECIES: DUF4333 domain-containing protein [unclassified Actinopolyspora]|uniref:DUF4333 domain-containing protein n=1 Tax=unclassified Actinopolyspora TaxID=2639451 RepID=UPI0013F63C22|nr:MULTISPECIES: DUF4333 domain-containing protein [unclassified Actinopolyspora]NHD17703.1 DUF4333 domain-containing protein [Actinopolyspora sp. BKK2]NHE76564.1 DUF4333 domain-containing protein [Actinopolyspora sp. BKK1]
MSEPRGTPPPPGSERLQDRAAPPREQWPGEPHRPYGAAAGSAGPDTFGPASGGSGAWSAGEFAESASGAAEPSGAHAASSGRGSRRWPWFCAALAVLVALGMAFLGFLAPGWFYRGVLDAGSVQAGVRQIVRDSYGVEGVESVSCPSGQPVRPGHSFTCEVSTDGGQQRVRVVVQDEEGTYAVERPD